MKPIVVINDDGEVGEYQHFKPIIILKGRSVGATTMGAALAMYYTQSSPKPQPKVSKPKVRSAYDLHANGGLPQLKQRMDQMKAHAKKPVRLY